MKPTNSLTSCCRHCRYYMPQGRRGGHCNQLNVRVESRWNACSLALPPFVTAWEKLEGMILWPQTAIAVQATALADPNDVDVEPIPSPASNYRSTRPTEAVIELA